MTIPLPLSGRNVSLRLKVVLPFKMAGVTNLILELPENDTTKNFEDIFRTLLALQLLK
jgi:hypothetical protein